jgi:hypothetical protein
LSVASRRSEVLTDPASRFDCSVEAFSRSDSRSIST